MSGNFQIWQNVLLQWVNCLRLQDADIEHIKTLGDGKIFVKILKISSDKPTCKVTTEQANEEIATFLKTEYPNYYMDAEPCEMEDEIEITYITSVLLYHSVVHCKSTAVVERMYNLKPDVQGYITYFLQCLLEERNITRNILKTAINSYNSTSPNSPNMKNESKFPTINLGTPKGRTLKEIYESPLAQKTKELVNRQLEVKRLNEELEAEQREKFELQEQLHKEQEKIRVLKKQLNEKNQEIRKLRDEWLNVDYESHRKSQGENAQEHILKKEIKNLETYTSTIEAELGSLQQDNDSLQQKLARAEQQCAMWQSKYEEYQSVCHKLQGEVEEKETELSHVKELYSDLQNHVQRLKPSMEQSIEEDISQSWQPLSPMSPVFSPENMGNAVVDVVLREVEEDNKRLEDQIKTMLLEENEMKNRISDLECCMEIANQNICSLKSCKLELERKVDVMTSLQHDLEESEKKLNNATVELDHLAEERNLLEQQLMGLNNLLACKDSELLECKSAANSLSVGLTELQERFEETQKILTVETEHVAKLEHEAKEAEEKLKLHSQAVMDIRTINIETQQNLESVDESLGENVNHIMEILTSDNYHYVEDTEPARNISIELKQTETLSAVCLSVKAKVQRLNYLLIELNAKNFKSLNAKSHLESTCQQLNENIKILHAEITELKSKGQSQLIEKNQLEECLQKADENIVILQTKVSEYIKEINDLTAVLEEKKSIIEQLEKVKQSIYDRNIKLEEENHDMKLKIEDITFELTDVKRSKNQIEDLYYKLLDCSEDQTKTISNLNCSIESLNLQIKELLEQQDFSYKNMEEISYKLQEVKESKDNLEQLYARFVDETEESVTNLNCESNLLKTKIIELKNKIIVCDRKVECLENSLAEVSRQKEVLKEKYETDSQEKNKHVQLLNEQLSLLKSDIVTLEDEKTDLESELENSRCKLSEIITKNEHEVETLNKYLIEKDDIISNLKIEMQSEVRKLNKEKETTCSELEATKTKLTEISTNKDELQDLFQKQNEEYTKELGNLTDKLKALTNQYKEIEQEKNTVLNNLFEKDNELINMQESYKILHNEIKQLELLTEKQKEQLEITSNKVEDLIQEKTVVTEELDVLKNELVKEKKYKESLSEEFDKKQKCLLSLSEKSNNLQSKIIALTDDRNMLQNTVQTLTSQLQNVETDKTNLLNSYNAMKLETERIVTVKLGLEQQIADLEKEKCSLNNNLDAAKSDLLLYKQQQEELIDAHSREVEELKVEIFQLNLRAGTLQEEINSLESDKKQLIADLDDARLEVSGIRMHNEQLEQLTNKIKAENEILENLKICLDDKIKQLEQDKNTVSEELEYVKISLKSVEESKAQVTDHYLKELNTKVEQINKLSKETDNLQKLLNEIIQERNNLDRNLIVTKSDLEKIEISKDELLREHAKQLQETEENIKHVHRNAVEIKTMLLKKIEEVEVERDMEKELHLKVEQLLEQEKGSMESVMSQMNLLISEKEMISKLCTDFRDNVYSLRHAMQSLPDKQQDTNISEEFAADSLHVLYDCKNKLSSEPWNLDHSDFVDVPSNKSLSRISEHESESSESTLSENSPCLEKSLISLNAKPADMKIAILEAQSDSDQNTSVELTEVVKKLGSLKTELVAARGEIMGVLKSNDILRNELSRTEKRCNEITQKYDQLAVTDGVLKAENESLLKSIESLNKLKYLLEESEKDLSNERILKEKIKLEKEALHLSYESLKSEFKTLTESNETVCKEFESVNDKITVLNKQNVKLNEKVAEYDNCRLKIEEESLKLRKIQQQVESEYENLCTSMDNIKLLISGFETKLKGINGKFEAIVLNMSVNCDELKVLEQQKSKLEKLVNLLHIEYDQISQDILKFAGQCLKETGQNNEKLHQIMENVKNKDDLVDDEIMNCEHHQLEDLQLQINTLVSSIEIAMLESCRVDTQCMNIMKKHVIETQPSASAESILSSADRMDFIKSLVTKIQDPHKRAVSEEVEFEVNDWNPEDSLEVQSQNNFEVEATEHSALLIMRHQFDQALKSNTLEIEELHNQKRSLSKELSNERDARAELEMNFHDVKKQNQTIISEKNSLAISKADVEDKCSQLEQKLLKMSEMKQAYDILLDENLKLKVEIEERKNKLAKMEVLIEEKIKAVRQEYEKKLERLKNKMRILYDEEIEKKMKKMKDESGRMQALCQDYKDKINSYQQEIAYQQSHIWELGDKLLLSDKEKKKLQEELIKQQDAMLERFDFKRKTDVENTENADIVDESITYVHRKKSIFKSLPTGMGFMFNPEDEEGEMFNTTNLADLKAGRCVPTYKGRISELQFRNSLCPPHLKSSYPAETQFHDPRQYKEEDLKLGCAVDQENLDTLSTNMLLPTEKQRKKDRGQTSYNKPGPPTPGKSGGRHSLQGTEVLTPRAPLRESNDGACVRKASTPSRLKSLFTTKNRLDESTPVTPHGRRLSNFFRRQTKIHH